MTKKIYRINYAEIEDYEAEQFITTLQCVCRLLNDCELITKEEILSIIGIVEGGRNE